MIKKLLIALLFGVLFFCIFHLSHKCPSYQIEPSCGQYKKAEILAISHSSNFELETIYAKLLSVHYKNWNVGEKSQFKYSEINEELEYLIADIDKLKYQEKRILVFCILAFCHPDLSCKILIAQILGADCIEIQADLGATIVKGKFDNLIIDEESILNINEFARLKKTSLNTPLPFKLNRPHEIDFRSELVYSKILFSVVRFEDLFKEGRKGLLIDESLYRFVYEIITLGSRKSLYLFLVLSTCEIDAGGAYALFDTLGAADYDGIIHSVRKISSQVFWENFKLSERKRENINSFLSSHENTGDR